MTLKVIYINRLVQKNSGLRETEFTPTRTFSHESHIDTKVSHIAHKMTDISGMYQTANPEVFKS